MDAKHDEDNIEGNEGAERVGESDVDNEIDSDEPDTPICPHCMEMLGPHDHMCPYCGAPLDMNASIGFERSLTEGFLWRAAANQPIPFIVVMGTWLLLAPQAIAGLGFGLIAPVMLVDIMKEKIISGFLCVSLITLIALSWGALHGGIVLKVTRNYLQQRNTTKKLRELGGGDADNMLG